MNKIDYNSVFKSDLFLCFIVVCVGFVLGYFVPSVSLSLFRYPLNVVCLALFVSLVLTCHAGGGKTKFLARLKSREMALAIITSFVYILILLGLIPQDRFLQTVQDDTIVRDLGLFTITRSYPFLLLYLLLLFVLGLTILSCIKRKSTKGVLLSISHVGLWIALAAGFFGAPDYREYRISVFEGQTSTMAIDQEGGMVPLAFSVKLNKFTVEYYDNSAPKRFASEVDVTLSDGVVIQDVIEVNNPLKFGGYYIYQTGYDTTPESKDAVSIFRVVYDPWLEAVYLGVAMLLLSAVMMIFYRNKIRGKQK